MSEMTLNQRWIDAARKLQVESCGRLDGHTYLPEDFACGRVVSDRIRYVYIKDGSEVVCLGTHADTVAFRAWDYERLAKRCEELGDVLQSIASNSLEFESDGSVWYTHYDKDDREAGHEAVDASQYLSFVVAKARAAIAAHPKEQADA